MQLLTPELEPFGVLKSWLLRVTYVVLLWKRLLRSYKHLAIQPLYDDLVFLAIDPQLFTYVHFIFWEPIKHQLRTRTYNATCSQKTGCVS